MGLFCTIAAACTPSHRLVHEGNRYFERCYGADFAVQVAENAKEACWQAWIAHYTKFQPAHRVDYALGRIESLQNGEPMPTLPGLPGMDAGTGAADDVVDAAVVDAAMVDVAVVDDGRDPSAAWLRSPLTAGDGGAVPHGCSQYCNHYVSGCFARCSRSNVDCQASCARARDDCLSGCY